MKYKNIMVYEFIRSNCVDHSQILIGFGLRN